jgi:hypothetical protein
MLQRDADHNGGIIEDGGHSRAVLGAGQEDFGRPVSSKPMVAVNVILPITIVSVMALRRLGRRRR